MTVITFDDFTTKIIQWYIFHSEVVLSGQGFQI